MKQIISTNEAELADASKTIYILKFKKSHNQLIANFDGKDSLAEQKMLLKEKVDTIDNLRPVNDSKVNELKEVYGVIEKLRTMASDRPNDS